jgi:hypothetical protein
MPHEHAGRAVDGHELEVRLRPVQLSRISKQELRDAIRPEHRLAHLSLAIVAKAMGNVSLVDDLQQRSDSELE